MTVPFVKGDEDGIFTQELVQVLSSSGLATLHPTHGDYRLCVSLLETREETTGFRIDPQEIQGQIQENIVPCEGRKVVTAEVTLFKGNSAEIAYGPYRLSQWVDYDFLDGDSLSDLVFQNGQSQPVSVLPFSLGQLEPLEAAQEACVKPLYLHLAQKIVDVISAEW